MASVLFLFFTSALFDIVRILIFREVLSDLLIGHGTFKPGFHFVISTSTTEHGGPQNKHTVARKRIARVYAQAQGVQFCSCCFSCACVCSYGKREHPAVGISISSPSCFTVSGRFGVEYKAIIHSAHAYVIILVEPQACETSNGLSMAIYQATP